MATRTYDNPDTDESLTNEDKVVDELRTADDPLSLSQLDERLPDVAYKAISATLSDLSAEGAVSREGEGGPTDPYRYKIDKEPENDALNVLFGDEEPEGEDTGLNGLFDKDDGMGEVDTTDREDAEDTDYTDHDADDGPTFEGLTIKEREIVAALSDVDDPQSVDEMTEWLVDRSKGSVGEMLRSLHEDGIVDREGSGVRGSPYTYTLPDDFEVPDDHDVDLPERPEDRADVKQITDTDPDRDPDEPRLTTQSDTTTDEAESVDTKYKRESEPVGGKYKREAEPDTDRLQTTRQIALEYARTANGDELVELWEAAGVMPEDDFDGADADFEGIPVDLPEDDWVDVVFAIGDSHIPIPETRELIGSINRQVWANGGPPDDREA